MVKPPTDNIFTLRQWCSNNFPEAKEQLENMYQEVYFLMSSILLVPNTYNM